MDADRGPLAHVVLHEPEIPNNTGSIGRTCVAFACALHLIHPLGFDLDEKAVRRAGLDYWPRLDLREHASLGAYEDTCAGARVWAMTARGGGSPFDADLRWGDHFLFGKESVGLPPAVLERYGERRLSFPMMPGERSLNVSNVVCATVTELVGRLLRRGELRTGPDGRLAFR